MSERREYTPTHTETSVEFDKYQSGADLMQDMLDRYPQAMRHRTVLKEGSRDSFASDEEFMKGIGKMLSKTHMYPDYSIVVVSTHRNNINPDNGKYVNSFTLYTPQNVKLGLVAIDNNPLVKAKPQ